MTRERWADFDELHKAFKPSDDAHARVKALLDAGADANAPSPDGYTILHFAARFQTAEVMQVLIDAGADVNAHNEDGRGACQTPLHFATKNWKDRAAQVRALLNAGADVNALDRTADRDGGNYTPLHYAAKAVNGSADAVRVLLAAGATVDARSAGNRTALHFAAQYSDANVVRALADAGADVMARDQYGWTPLHFVTKRSHPKHPADTTAARSAAETATARSAAVVEALLEAGTDVNVGGSPLGLSSGSPLICAAFEQSVVMVERVQLWRATLSANKGETRREKMLRVGRGREMHDGTRRRNEDERSAPLFKGGQAKRGSDAGSGGDGEGDEAALHGGIQAVGHREGGRLRDAG